MKRPDLSWKTAIQRKSLSAPMRLLRDRNLLRGRVLDYGCGHGHDADSLGLESYDPHFRPALPDGAFDTITMIFVLNVIASARKRQQVVASAQSLLRPKGHLYIAVRSDGRELNGYTRLDTWQGLIRLRWPVLARQRGFVIHVIKSSDS